MDKAGKYKLVGFFLCQCDNQDRSNSIWIQTVVKFYGDFV